MTSAIDGSYAAATSTTASTTASSGSYFDSETFLQLLVAQLKYQDPSNPTDSSEFMSQTATLAQVQSLEEISTQNSEMLTLQQSLSAGALVGQTVSYTGTDGSTKTGVVSSVKIASGSASESTAVIDGAQVSLGRISEISQTAH